MSTDEQGLHVQPSPRLAILVPYFKFKYFEETLEALKRQTNHNFQLYIMDDAAQVSPVETIEASSAQFPIFYHRFERNMGGIDLARHWNRCLTLVSDADWIWLVPDDDVPSANAVHEILLAARRADLSDADILHIPLARDPSEEQRQTNLEEALLSADDFIGAYLRGVAFRDMTLANTVYRVNRLQEIGGFVSFPRGWSSDQITTISAAGGKNIIIVEKASLEFRMSGENISSQTTDGDEKILAGTLSLKWLISNLDLGKYVDVADFMKSSYFRAEFHFINTYPFTVRGFFNLSARRRLCLGGIGYIGAIKATLKKVFSRSNLKAMILNLNFV